MSTQEETQDIQLRRLFAGFRPEAPTGQGLFMASLQRRLDAVETVRKSNAALLRRRRLAAAMAFAAGAVAGTTMGLLLPHIGTKTISGMLDAIAPGAESMMMLAIGTAGTAIIAINDYEIALSFLSQRQIKK